MMLVLRAPIGSGSANGEVWASIDETRAPEFLDFCAETFPGYAYWAEPDPDYPEDDCFDI